ncbi:TIGR00180 family glycosyltransferase [Candidatus Pelagibacter sp.]|jgi:glycosyltransferase domain-containing protein|nr:TIGR00180 family glycosyltransferase [Candidatus Pelagibacter sp.]
MNITILIPTRNRFDELKKLLIYYKNQNFTGNIFLIDSSRINIFEKTKNFLRKLKNKRIKHFRFVGRPFECTKFVTNRIVTKYVCWSGDDDYYIVNGIKKSINILEKNQNIDALNGLSIVANFSKQNNLNFNNYSIYDNFYSSKTKSIERLVSILNNYKVPIFSIFRSKIFFKIMKCIPGRSQRNLCPTRIIHDEYLESLLIVNFNKIYNYNFPLLIRTVPKKKYAKLSIENLKKQNQLNFDQKKSVLFLEKTIFKLLKNNKDRKTFSDQLRIFFQKINKKKSKNIYFKFLKMQIRKLYLQIFTKNFNSFFKIINKHKK